jgi:hypothetical protein
VENLDSNETIITLLYQLQKKAKSIGADGLILTKKKTENLPISNNTAQKKQQVSFSAELIKQCKEERRGNKSRVDNTVVKITERRVAAYNHKGIRTKGIITIGGITSKLSFSLFNNSNVERPEISNSEISLENGVYGIKLGDSFQQVIKAFGEPSVQLALLEHELIIGYGRRHWFHFQFGVLVKVQNKLPFLSADILNKIPLLDFFDEHSWLIQNKTGRESLLADVYTELELDTRLNKKNKLVLNNQDSRLTLNFIYSINYNTNEKTYTLDTFSMQTNNYKEGRVLPFNHQVIQNKAIEQAYLALVSNEDLNLKELEGQLGDPIGRIVLSKYAALNIYNHHLLLHIRNSELIKIHFIEEGFAKIGINNYSKNAWVLGDFIQGKSFNQLKPYFPDNVFESDDGVEIETEKYMLFLHFDEDNQQNSLYEAEIRIY